MTEKFNKFFQTSFSPFNNAYFLFHKIFSPKNPIQIILIFLKYHRSNIILCFLATVFHYGILFLLWYKIANGISFWNTIFFFLLCDLYLPINLESKFCFYWETASFRNGSSNVYWKKKWFMVHRYILSCPSIFFQTIFSSPGMWFWLFPEIQIEVTKGMVRKHLMLRSIFHSWIVLSKNNVIGYDYLFSAIKTLHFSF